MKYYSIAASVNDSLLNYKEALDDYKIFYGLVLDTEYENLKQKLRSSEQRHSRELVVQKENKAKNNLIWGLIGSAVFLAMGIIILVIAVRKNHIKKQLAIQREQYVLLENEKLKSESDKLSLENQNLALQNEKRELEAENLRHRVNELENERDRLSSLLDTSELPTEVIEAVKVRVEMLNGLMASYITSNEKHERPYETWVKELVNDKESFMKSTRLALKASHPDFIDFFEKHGLTEDEINYVCLYAIGLNGKEVGEYIQRKSHIHISSAIRKKLGIDMHDTNLSIYVRRKLKS